MRNHITITWIRTLLSFEILRLVHTCVRGSRTPFHKILAKRVCHKTCHPSTLNSFFDCILEYIFEPSPSSSFTQHFNNSPLLAFARISISRVHAFEFQHKTNKVYRLVVLPSQCQLQCSKMLDWILIPSRACSLL